MAQFGTITSTGPFGGPTSSPDSPTPTPQEEEKKCYKLLTAQGRYHQELTGGSAPWGGMSMDIVLTDIEFNWICACKTKAEASRWRNDGSLNTALIPLPPTTGPTAYPDPKDGNYWQERSFRQNVRIVPTDENCDPTKSVGSQGTSEGGTTQGPPVSDRKNCFGGDYCIVPEERISLPDSCEGRPCKDAHTRTTSILTWNPTTWIRTGVQWAFGCYCKNYVQRAIISALDNIGTCLIPPCEPTRDNRCCCESEGWENGESFECTVSGETESV